MNPCIDCVAKAGVTVFGKHCRNEPCRCSCHLVLERAIEAPDRLELIANRIWWALWGFAGGATFMRWWLS